MIWRNVWQNLNCLKNAHITGFILLSFGNLVMLFPQCWKPSDLIVGLIGSYYQSFLISFATCPMLLCKKTILFFVSDVFCSCYPPKKPLLIVMCSWVEIFWRTSGRLLYWPGAVMRVRKSTCGYRLYSKLQNNEWVSRSCAERSSAAAKRGLSPLAGHTWRIVWRMPIVGLFLDPKRRWEYQRTSRIRENLACDI